VRIFDVATRQLLSAEPMRQPVAWSRDGTRVAGVIPTGVAVIDAHDGHTVVRVATERPSALALDDRGRRLLVASEHSEIWSVAEQRRELALDERSDENGLSGDGMYVIGWRPGAHSFDVWNIADRRVEARAAVDGEVLGANGFAADGRHALVSAKDAATSVPLFPNAARVGGYDVHSGRRDFQLPAMLLPFLTPSRARIVAVGMRRDVEVCDASTGALVSHLLPGPGFVIAGSDVLDGQLLLTLGAGAVVRSMRDSRPLGALQLYLAMEFTQDTFNAGGSFDVIDNGRGMIALGPHPLIWRLPFETRSVAEVDAIVRARVRWRVTDGRLVPVQGTLHGRVMRHGQPVARAEVHLERVGLAEWPQVIADDRGRFVLGELPYEQSSLIVMAPDRSAKGIHAITIDRDDVQADIELDDEATISGSVIDTDGKPVAGIEVRAFQGVPDPGALGAKTDASGRFTIRALGPRTFTVRALENIDGKPTGLRNTDPAVKVVLTRRDEAAVDVKIVVRRGP
jgi:hypothetical protein